jgi:TonB family protein
VPRLPSLALIALLLPTAALSYEGAVHREEVDGGVHVPVLTKPPELVHFEPAVYPEEARREGLAGDVKLAVTIAADGTVADAVVTGPAGHGFDEAAVAAAKQFTFTPAEVDGVPAPIQIEYVYHFALEVPDAGTAPPPPPPEATLKGQLISRGSRKRVIAGSVRCGDAADAPEAVSDEEGRFELKLTPGPCAITATANGYEPYRTSETLEPGELREVVYYLVPRAIGFETVVRGEREKKEVVRRTVERAEMERIPGTFGDPLRVIQNFPGVARAPAISGALIVRGASPDETNIFMDGVEIPILYHLGGGPSVVNEEFLDHVDFYPGGFGARYGRAIGGAVDVATRKGTSETWHGAAKVDFLDSSFFLEAPVLPGVSVAAAARRSYIDVLLPIVQPDNSITAVPRYWDYQVRVDWGAGRKPQPGQPSSSFYLMAFGSDDVLKVLATGGFRNRDINLDIHTLFHRVKGDWTYRNGNFSSVFSPFLGYDLGEASFGISRLKADQYSIGFREDASLEIRPWLVARAGGDVMFEHLVGTAELPLLSGVQYAGFPGAEPAAPTQSLSRSPNTFDGAFYLEADVKLGAFTLTPGVRSSYARVYGHDLFAAEPRFWARWQPWKGFALKGSAGLYSQPPESTDMDAEPFGTPTLHHEWAFQTSVGVEQKITDVINVDLTGFFNRRYERVVAPGLTTEDENGLSQTARFGNLGLGRAYGLELLLKHELTKQFFGWLAYTFSRTEQRRVGARDYRLGGFDQTHILTAVGSYRLPHGWEIGARFRYVTGRPYAHLAHSYDVVSMDTTSFGCQREPADASRFPDFHQLDIRLDRSWLFDNFTLSVYADVQNVYNAQNIETYFSDYRCREEVAVPGIPVLPVLGVKGTF